MRGDIVAVNSENLKKLILEIYSYRDKMSKILEDAELIAQSSKEYYKSDDGEKFRSKFQKLSSTFPTFLANIRSYGRDLEIVLQKYKNNDIRSVDIFERKW